MTSQNTITPVESWMASIMTLTEHLQVYMPPSIHTRYFLTLIQAQPLAQTKRPGHLVRTFQVFSLIGREVFQLVEPGEVVEGPSGGGREAHVGQALRALHEVSGGD